MNRLWFVLLWRAFLTVKAEDYSCYDFQFNPRVCLPGPIDVAKNHQFDVDPNFTCGLPPSKYCRSAKPSGCYICNVSSTTNNHPVHYMTDQDYPLNYWNFGYKPTWWQSITWWDAKQNNLLTNGTLKIHLTLSMNKSYDLTGTFKITFYSSKPHAFIIEKSSDFGNRWTSFRYYADQCSIRFPNVPLISQANNSRTAYCTEHQSLAAVQGSQVTFEPSYTRSNFWSRETQDYLTATDFRISLEYPWTDNNEQVNQESFLNKYYYDITDIQIHGRCHCNGHAPYCDNNKQCYCQHNTNGVDCEQCLPLFNNKPWRPAEAPNKPNPCEACNCNNHADRCYYNATLDHGICDDCKNGTAGNHCEECKELYYRNTNASISDPETCIACDCYLDGITNNGECLQNATTPGQIAGQCSCKPNVHGRKCDGCEEGFFGLRLPPVGSCEACNCSLNGTENMDSNCAQITGQCSCKQTTVGLTCSSCKPGYYHFPQNAQDECKRCECDLGGALNDECNQETGDCWCRKGITGRHCNITMDGMYTPAFNHYLLEAESGKGSFMMTSRSTGFNEEFTGFGYAQLTMSSHLELAFNPDFTSLFQISLRYYELQEPLNVSLEIDYSNASVSFQLLSTNITLPAKVNQTEIAELIMIRNGGYTIKISSESSHILLLDSAVLLPDFKDSRFYQNSVVTVKEEVARCWNESFHSRLLEFSAPCQPIVFSSSAEWFKGTKECGCNPIGSKNTVCSKFGGQCSCKVGVMGVNCDQCMAGYHNFWIFGCQKCSCDMDGSKDFACSRSTGQCSCKENVTSRICGRCKENFYGFGTTAGCQDCQCNSQGSSTMQCLGDGACVCKDSTRGGKCDQCEVNYFNFTTSGCSACGCDNKGSVDLQCHQTDGLCTCKENVVSNKCGSCKLGHFNLAGDNDQGCQQCFCYNKTQSCQSASGYYFESIPNNLYDWTLSNGDDFHVSEQQFSFNFTGDVFKITAPQTYVGDRLYLLHRKLVVRFEMKFPPAAAVQEKMRAFHLVLIGANNLSTTFKLENISSDVPYAPEFLLTADSANVTTWQLQSILFQLKAVELYFMGSPGDRGFFYGISMDQAIPGRSTFGGIEECSCPMNYTGRSCQRCADGYTREELTFSAWDNCHMCSCNNRSKECHPETGTCYNCQHGTEGEFCERCQPNVQEPNCDQCLPGYYGYDNKEFVGCKACDCIAVNTVNNRTDVCDAATGQCECKPDIGGRICDRCAENAVNISRACTACSTCHGLVQGEVHLLRIQIKQFDAVIYNASSAGDLLSNATFPKLLSNISTTVMRILSQANASSELERDLREEMGNLGETFERFEELLNVNISKEVNTIKAKVPFIASQQNKSQELMKTIYNYLWMSVYVIKADLQPLSTEISPKIQSLRDISANLSAVAEQRMINFAPVLRNLSSLLNSTAYTMRQTANLASISLDIGMKLNDTKKKLNELQAAVKGQELLATILLDTSLQLFNLSSVIVNDSENAAKEIRELDVTTPEELLKELKLRNDTIVGRIENLTTYTQHVQTTYRNVFESAKEFMNISSAVLRDVAGENETTKEMYKQVVRVSEVVQNASAVANATFETAQKMLLVLQNYEDAIFNSSASLKNTMEILSKINDSSVETKQSVEKMKSLAVGIFMNASKLLNGSRDVRDESKLQNEKVIQLFDMAREMSNNSMLVSFNSTELQIMFRKINNIGYKSFELKSRCTNSTNVTSHVSKQAADSLKWASEAKSDQQRQAGDLQSVYRDMQNIKSLNATRIDELQNTINQSRTKLDRMSLTHALTSLRNARNDQEQLIATRKEQLTALRKEVEGLNNLYASMKSAPGCGLD